MSDIVHMEKGANTRHAISRGRRHRPQRPLWHYFKSLICGVTLDWSDKEPRKWKKKSEPLHNSALIFIISQFLASYLQFTSNALLTGENNRPAACDVFLHLHQLVRNMYRRNIVMYEIWKKQRVAHKMQFFISPAIKDPGAVFLCIPEECIYECMYTCCSLTDDY